MRKIIAIGCMVIMPGTLFFPSEVVSRGSESPTVVSQELTTHSLYERLNLRTFYSSLGDKLENGCQKFPADIFPESDVEFVSASKMILRGKQSLWKITVVDFDTIRVDDIVPLGTFRSAKILDLNRDADSDEWRANEAEIPFGSGCADSLNSA